MKKVLLALFIILLMAGCGVLGFMTINYQKSYKQVKGEKQVLVEQNAQLQNAIDAIGPMATVYTVSAEMFTGKKIVDTDLAEMTVPVSSIEDGETILDSTEILGKYWKIDIKPGTTITKSLIMDSELKDIVYERDMSFESLPLGIEVGDYIDIKIVLPYGQSFYVMTHKRIEQLVIDTFTIKLYLTATEMEIWESAIRDYSLYKQKGMKLCVEKYVEPGLQKAVAYYPVRAEIADLIKVSPNVPDYTVCVSEEVRAVFDSWVKNVTTEDASMLAAGVTSEASKQNSARSTYRDSGQSGNASTAGEGTEIEDLDLNQAIDDLQNQLNGLNPDTNEEPTTGDDEDPIQ